MADCRADNRRRSALRVLIPTEKSLYGGVQESDTFQIGDNKIVQLSEAPNQLLRWIWKPAVARSPTNPELHSLSFASACHVSEYWRPLSDLTARDIAECGWFNIYNHASDAEERPGVHSCR